MVNIPLDDAIAAVLLAKAAARGVSVQEYLANLVPAVPARSSPRLTVEEFDRLFDEEAMGDVSPTGTFSRTELYRDHD